MSTTITANQLALAEASLNTAIASPTATNIAATWNLLSSFGDSYATAAYQVIAQPTSLYGEVVRNSWAAAGADFAGKFDSVAIAHLSTYISVIGQTGLSQASYSLPSTTQIGTSYYNALNNNGVPSYAAIDFSLAKTSGAGLGPDWYSSPWITFGTGLGLEASRIGPTAPEVANLDLSRAIEHLAAVTAETADTLLTTGALTNATSEIEFLNQGANAIYQAVGLPTITVTSVGGITFYNDHNTGIMAIFDKTDAGQAYINGSWQSIDSSTWRYNSTTGYYEFRTSSIGLWQEASQQPVDTGAYQLTENTQSNDQQASIVYAFFTPDVAMKADTPGYTPGDSVTQQILPSSGVDRTTKIWTGPDGSGTNVMTAADLTQNSTDTVSLNSVTINLGAGTVAFISGTGNTIDMNATGDTVNASGVTVNLGSGFSETIVGNHNVIASGSADTVSLTGTALTFNGGGDTVNLGTNTQLVVNGTSTAFPWIDSYHAASAIL